MSVRGIRVSGLRVREGLAFRVWGLGFRVSDFGLTVSGGVEGLGLWSLELLGVKVWAWHWSLLLAKEPPPPPKKKKKNTHTHTKQIKQHKT